MSDFGCDAEAPLTPLGDTVKVFQITKDHFIAGYKDFDRAVFCIAKAENYDPGEPRHVRQLAHPRGSDLGGAGVTRLALVAVVALAACAHDERGNRKAAAGADQTPVPVVTSPAEAKAAIGKRVRVRGTAERDKLGDAVSSQGFSIVCLAPRFPDARLGQPVVVEGLLERTDELQATKGPNGEIS